MLLGQLSVSIRLAVLTSDQDLVRVPEMVILINMVRRDTCSAQVLRTEVMPSMVGALGRCRLKHIGCVIAFGASFVVEKGLKESKGY